MNAKTARIQSIESGKTNIEIIKKVDDILEDIRIATLEGKFFIDAKNINSQVKEHLKNLGFNVDNYGLEEDGTILGTVRW